MLFPLPSGLDQIDRSLLLRLAAPLKAGRDPPHGLGFLQFTDFPVLDLLQPPVGEYVVHDRFDPVSRERVLHACERTPVDRDDRTTGGCDSDERWDVAANAGDAGHLNLAAAIEGHGHMVGELR